MSALGSNPLLSHSCMSPKSSLGLAHGFTPALGSSSVDELLGSFLELVSSFPTGETT